MRRNDIFHLSALSTDRYEAAGARDIDRHLLGLGHARPITTGRAVVHIGEHDDRQSIIDENVAIRVHVPIHFLNETTCYGVKTQGGMIQHQTTDIEVQCLPANIPTYIEVDMLEVHTGQIVHLSDITLPAGVTSVALALGEDHDLAIASVVAPKGGDEDGAPTAGKDSGDGAGNSEE